MKGILNKDITLKIISVLIAIVLWIYVVDVQNPETETTLKNIPITLVGGEYLTEEGLVILNDINQTLNLKVKGRRKSLAALDKKDIKAFADLRGLNRTGEHSIQVQVEMSAEGVSILEKDPYLLVVKLDKIMEVQKPIEVVSKGEVKEPYIAMEPKVTPNTVTLKGPSSIISTIDSVRVSVDLSGQTKDIVSEQKYDIYNKAGERITSNLIKRDVETVHIEYPILKSKQVAVAYRYTGSVAENHVITKTEVIPSAVRVAGPGEIIDKLAQLTTEPIDINGLDSSVEVDASIQMPEGVRLITPSRSVKVKIDVEEQIINKFVIDDIRVDNVPENLSYKLITKQLEVSIKGVRRVLSSLKDTDIHAYIDIKNMEEGEYDVPVIIQVPSNVEVVGNYVATIRLSRQGSDEETTVETYNSLEATTS
ncbi:MAG: hypothetical protein GX066_00070 [Clostridiaceae bacterium]|nr:hypothetical protein [Clostridiaceae bacterium]